MTKFDQIKILENKIKANKAPYMLDRKNAEISAKSSGELDKYEYLTDEYLGYKTDALTQEKFEYSPLGKVFTAGLVKSDKTEGLLKTLKNVENKSGNQLTVLNNLFNRALTVLGITGRGLIKMGLMKMGLINLGLMNWGLIKMGLINWSLIKMGLMTMGMISGGLMKMGLIKMEKKIKNIMYGDIT